MPTSHYEAIRDLIDGFDRRALAAFRTIGAVAKADGSPVTQVDRETTESFLAALRERFPAYGLLIEEEPRPYAPEAEWQWVIDPLDGTAVFARGFPVWGLGMGLVHGGRAVEGYLSFPALGERYVCTGGEMRFNGIPHHPRPEPLVAQTLNLLIGSDLLQELPLRRLGDYKLRNFGTNLYHLVSVALGRAEAMISPRCFLWDLLPAWPFVLAAGLEARFLDGTPFDLAPFWRTERRTERLPAALVVGAPRLVAELIDRLAGHGR